MQTLRVLVADDEAGMRLGVARVLRDCRLELPEAGEEVAFTVELAENGEQALAAIQRHAPDILLLDYKMPGVSGLDVLDRLATQSLDMLTVMVTAYATIETAVLATKRGAYDFLAKPFTPDELKSVLRKTAARLVLARQARLLAEEKRQVRFEFVRVLGHELKAPLAAVSSCLELVRLRALGGELSAYDEPIARSQARLDGMHRLIRDLLDLTRIESGLKHREVERLDLAALARAAIETQEPAAAARRVTLELCAPAPVTAAGDRGELEMVLNNLLSNAVKYNREGGRVVVTLAASGEQAVLTVRDTGIGMTRENVARLFGEFVRIRTSETAHIDGSGLGLSIVRKLVELNGGRIGIESEPGAGTVVTVTLGAGAASSAPGAVA